MRRSEGHRHSGGCGIARALLGLACVSQLALGAVSQAQPALDLFDEAVYDLSLQYGGFAEHPPQTLAPDLRAELVARCGAREDCPAELGVEAIERLIADLGDPHTAYLPPRTFAEAQRLLGPGGGRRPGFGLQVAAFDGRPGLVVLRALAGGPGAESGVRRGDVVVAIDGDPLGTGAPAVERLRQMETSGESVALTVERGPDVRFDVELVPGPVVVEPALTLLDDGIGYLDIPSFFAIQETGPAVHRRVREALAAGVRSLVIDLRHDPGGLLPESLVAAGAFVAEARRTVRTRRDATDWVFADGRLRVETSRGQTFTQYEVADPARFDGPLVLLVNGSTASAAEFFAHDLREAGALVVGEPTFGVADTGTGFIGLSNGGGLQITIGKILNRDGAPYPARVEPDMPVDDSLEALAKGEDRALQEAIERLRGRGR